MKRTLKKIITYMLCAVLTAGVLYLKPVEAAADTGWFDYRTELGKLEDGEKMQQAYDILYEGIRTSQTSIDVSELGVTFDQFYVIRNVLVENCPELFWFTGSMNATTEGEVVLTLTPSYLFTGNSLTVAKYKFDSAVQKVVDSIDALADDYTKEKAIHDYLVENIKYVSNASYNQSAYSALVNKETVCAGYAKAFKILCNKLGIECLYITGKSYQYSESSKYTENHAWNMVGINGAYYMVDVTWDDLGDSNPISYGYFNLTSELFMPVTEPDSSFIGTSHVPFNKAGTSYYRDYYENMPECTETGESYYGRNTGLLYIKAGEETSITREQVVSALTNPLDGACRVFVEDLSARSDVASALYSVLGSDYTDIGIASWSKRDPRYVKAGYEIFLTLVTYPGVVVYGEIDYDGSTEDVLTVNIKDSSGVIVYSRQVSGPGASYSAYGLADGDYTICYSHEGGAIQTEEISVAASSNSSTLKNNRVKYNLELHYEPVEPVLYGDVNNDGEIDGRDGILLAQYLAEWEVTIDLVASDCNGDGEIDGRDGILLAQYLAEWEVTLGPEA